MAAEPESLSDDPLDWRGRPIRCRECSQVALNLEGLCRKGSSCVRDRRAKRVDLFFRGHPHLADSYLDHVYF